MSFLAWYQSQPCSYFRHGEASKFAQERKMNRITHFEAHDPLPMFWTDRDFVDINAILEPSLRARSPLATLCNKWSASPNSEFFALYRWVWDASVKKSFRIRRPILRMLRSSDCTVGLCVVLRFPVVGFSPVNG